MNFTLFSVIIFVSGIVATFIFSIGLMLCLAPLTLFAKLNNSPKTLALPFVGIAAIYQIYFWGLWAAFCVVMIFRFTQKPEVTWDWLYWLVGFMECISLIGWLAQKERQSSETLVEARRTEKGTIFYSLVIIAAFGLFAFVPSLTSSIYGWALQPLGFETSTFSDIPPQYVADRKSLSEAFAAFKEANQLSQVPKGMTSYTPPPEVENKIDILLHRGLVLAYSVSDDFLDWLDPDMKQHFREQFVKGQQLYTDGRKETNVVKQALGNELLRHWYEDYWQQHSERIADKAFPPPYH